MRRQVRLALLAGLVAATAGCGGTDDQDRTLRVFAAASLTATFERVAERFEAAHDGVEVELVFGGSSDLVAQITEGAPADVFASADEATMGRLVDAGLAATEPQVFASNTLQVVVPADNPAGITTFADLARDGVDVVACAPEVPCGAAAQRLAEAAGVMLSPVSEEQSVTDVLGKVTSGEADAGLVYLTDVIAAGDAVMGVPVREAGSAVNLCAVAPVAGSDAEDLAAEFVELVLSEPGQRVLRDAGFAPAP